MSKTGPVIIALAALALLLGLAGAGPLRSTGAFTEPVASVRTINLDGARLDWSRSLNLIAFDRLGPDGFYDVYTMQPDGSQQVCLTCATPALPGKHMGNPTWHPSGHFIAFQAEKASHEGTSESAKPGFGINNDLWLVTSDGALAWKLLDIAANRVSLHPQFSHDGTRLMWSSGAAIRLADFVVDGAGPRLENIRSYQPVGRFFYETHGFSSDDSRVIFTALADGQPLFSMDIYTLDLNTGAVLSLTASTDQWDEHAQFSPSAQKVVWMSSTGCDCDPRQFPLLNTDLWMMNADGSNKTRLTYFRDKTLPEYMGRRVIVGDMSWGPDGRSLAVRLIVGLREAIAIVEFREPQ